MITKLAKFFVRLKNTMAGHCSDPGRGGGGHCS